MRKFIILLTAILISMVASFTSFAGDWKQDEAGWWYDNGDSTFAKDGWNWIDGKCYYFTTDGYCLINTTTPDGYTVDENGAWIIDGVVQTQETSVQTFTLGDLTLKMPENFRIVEISDTRISFDSLKYMTVLQLSTETFDLSDDFDLLTLPALKNYTSHSVVQFGNTTWDRFFYDSPTDLESIDVTYIRRVDNRVYLALVAVGYDGEPINPDALMSEFVMN